MSNQNFRPGSSSLPDVVKNILIINVVVFLATIVLANQGISLIDRFGLHYFQSEEFSVWQFITYMFLHDIGSPGHIAFAHIGMNMLILFMFGPPVEYVWGPKRFLKYYLITGIGAALTHYIILYFQLQPELTFFNDYINSSHSEMSAMLNNIAGKYYYTDQFITEVATKNLTAEQSIAVAEAIKTQMLNGPVMIGASGAIFGILLAYGMLFPNSILYVFLMIPMKAKYAVFLFGLLELYLGIHQSDNVAHFAHLGGILTGLILFNIQRLRPPRRDNDFFQ